LRVWCRRSRSAIWSGFGTIPFESLHQIFGKKERARYGKVEESLGYFLKRDPKASALCMEKPKPLKQLASPMAGIVKWNSPKGL
jgi:hypothetical protein